MSFGQELFVSIAKLFCGFNRSACLCLQTILRGASALLSIVARSYIWPIHLAASITTHGRLPSPPPVAAMMRTRCRRLRIHPSCISYLIAVPPRCHGFKAIVGLLVNAPRICGQWRSQEIKHAARLARSTAGSRHPEGGRQDPRTAKIHSSARRK